MFVIKFSSILPALEMVRYLSMAIYKAIKESNNNINTFAIPIQPPDTIISTIFWEGAAAGSTTLVVSAT
jgi:hypothetical protein